eukprot:s192_g48.t1
MELAMGGAVPEVGTLRQTLADIRQQLEQKQLQLQNVARHGQEILSEEETLRRKLEEAQEADNQGDEVSPDTQMHTEHSRLSQVERIEWQNQNLAEELEEMERNLSNSPPRRRVRSEVLKTTEERLEHLRQELADLRHAEETQETRWQLEERNLSSELQEAKQQDEAMLKALADKLQSVNDKNRKLEEDLRLEEEKTQEKTSSLDAEVSRLRGSLWWFTTPATPSELWSGASSASSHRPDRPDRPSPRASPRASAVSVAVSGVSGCISQGTSRASASSSKRQSVHSLRSTSSKDSEPRARRRATRSFKSLQDMPSLNSHPPSATSASTSAAVGTASTLARRASVTMGELMDDALLSVGELLGDSKAEGVSAPTALETSKSKSTVPAVPPSNTDTADVAQVPGEAENAQESSTVPTVPTFTELWEASSGHRASATAAFAHFGTLLQQQVNSAAEYAGRVGR